MSSIPPVGALDGTHIATTKPSKSGSEFYSYGRFLGKCDYSGLFLAGSASPGQCCIQIPVGRCWFKWINIRCTNISSLQVEEKDGTLEPTEALGIGGLPLLYVLVGDDSFALKPFLVKATAENK